MLIEETVSLTFHGLQKKSKRENYPNFIKKAS